MPNLGGWELLIIVLVIVLLFGAKKLPDAARSLGRSMRIFRSEVKEMGNDDAPSAEQKQISAVDHGTDQEAQAPQVNVKNPQGTEQER
ncbi:hypothetical protein CATYP_05295 [Corynebacterium atypicum]|uniref:Sec-independent protein translocase protein TatA n=1 Tax=Corynebacterium atypicum TaxID=191610 RepID=A0ABN4DD17_9CORY|nr:Sec-independent protein translocase subunit TatA [Corynebacterium atypicum]AIG64138.1 hypothetical protein CATYP_05295 [Corynebacterium atypicum]